MCVQLPCAHSLLQKLQAGDDFRDACGLDGVLAFADFQHLGTVAQGDAGLTVIRRPPPGFQALGHFNGFALCGDGVLHHAQLDGLVGCARLLPLGQADLFVDLAAQLHPARFFGVGALLALACDELERS